MKIFKRTIQVIVSITLLFILYLLVSFVFVFKTTKVVAASHSYSKEELLKTSEQSLYATLIETPKEAMDIRIRLLEEANEKIYISYYFYHEDEAALIFTGALLHHANAGKDIHLLVDGKTPSKGDNYKILTNHPNIKFYLYEPINIFKVYALNNVMHDKLIIIDNKYGLTGGRNISDRFLLQDEGIKTHDRDILVFSDEDNSEPVVQMASYYDDLLNYKYTKRAKPEKTKRLEELQQKALDSYNDYYDSTLELNYFTEEKAIKVDNATYLRSPISRMLKEPVVAKTIFSLHEPEDKMIIQSPYITSSNVMKTYFPLNGENKNITFLTNSVYTNPNFFATTGYYPIRGNLAKNYEVYEYQGSGSIHGKTITINNNISVVGSLNIDSRSFFLSTESALVVISEEFNECLTNSVDELVKESLKVKDKKTYYENELIEAVKPNKTRFFFTRFISSIHKIYDHLLFFVH